TALQSGAFVRKLSIRQKLRQLRIMRLRQLRVGSRRRAVRAAAVWVPRPNAVHRGARDAASRGLDRARRGLPRPEVRRGLFFTGPEEPGRRANLIMAPSNLAVMSNYRETLGFIYEQRYRYYVRNEPVG